jgi:surfeit locus 1 family protein
MLSRYFLRPKPIPLIMSAGAVLLMFGLGAWQVQRLIWKEALLAQIEYAASQAPLLQMPDDPKPYRFYRVQLEGEYLPDAEFHLAARYFRSQLGYALLTPFRLADDGRIVIVSRGWIPTQHKDNPPPAPEGNITLLAQIRTSDERNPFTPPNDPARNIWFGRDALQMGEQAGLDVLPITLDAIGDQDTSVLPIPSDGALRPRNDHLGYAITWFGVGIGVLIMSLLYHRKKPSDG